MKRKAPTLAALDSAALMVGRWLLDDVEWLLADGQPDAAMRLYHEATRRLEREHSR